MPKILIVGAPELLAELRPTILGSHDVEHIFAPTPSAALEVARAFVPSLVVVDGSEATTACAFIRRLRESPGTRRASILALSRSGPVSEDELLRSGANLVLTGAPDSGSWNDPIERLLTIPRRLRTHVPVRITLKAHGGGADPRGGTALDVSIAGMLVETPEPLELGASLEVRFRLPGGEAEIDAPATVVRTNPGVPSHSGLRFLGLPKTVRDRIHALLATAPLEKAFGRYEILGLLGEGAMGLVYRAFDPLAHRVVAVKTPKPEAALDLDAEEYMKRFRREAQAAARLAHPHIVTVFDVGEDYFAMELLEGATLEAVLRRQGMLPVELALRILRPVAEALDFAHHAGTIHRDIKPANIMILTDGRTKVMDFGVAHVSSAVITASGKAFGSPAYMAPEQIVSGAATSLSDVFSLAVVAYEMLSGRRPFEGKSITPVLYQVVNIEPAPLTNSNPALPAHLDDVFRKALAKEPQARYQTAVSFINAIEGREQEGEVVAATMSAPPTPSGAPEDTHDLGTKTRAGATTSKRRAWMVPASLVALAALAGFVTLRRQAHPSPTPGLQITTEPAGAAVVIDSKRWGVTPLFLPRFPGGVHGVRVELENYAPAELRVTTTVEGPPVPLRFVLQQLQATVDIESDPTPAQVQVDAARAGETPLERLVLKPGPHDIRVERPGFEAWTQALDLGPGEKRRILARLKSTGPAGAQGGLRRLGWVHRGDLVGLGPGVTPPERIGGRAPGYPPAARRLGMTGSVTVELVVTEKGEVLNPHIVESADELLNQAMLDAVRSWLYRPAESNGVQVRVSIRERHTFGP